MPQTNKNISIKVIRTSTAKKWFGPALPIHIFHKLLQKSNQYNASFVFKDLKLKSSQLKNCSEQKFLQQEEMPSIGHILCINLLNRLCKGNFTFFPIKYALLILPLGHQKKFYTHAQEYLIFCVIHFNSNPF